MIDDHWHCDNCGRLLLLRDINLVDDKRLCEKCTDAYHESLTVYLRKRTPEEKDDYVRQKLAEWQLEKRVLMAKLEVARNTLIEARMSQTMDKSPLTT